MTPESQIYQNEALRSLAARKARRAWQIALAVVTAWLGLILAAPLARITGFPALSQNLYGFFSYICHQIPERTFHVSGEPMGVCTRCFGVYLGIVIGFAAYPLWRDLADTEPPPRFWLFASLIPVGVDWSLTILGIWENTGLSRSLTGLVLGFACATFIIPALVEIFQNIGAKGRLNAA